MTVTFFPFFRLGLLVAVDDFDVDAAVVSVAVVVAFSVQVFARVSVVSCRLLLLIRWFCVHRHLR